MPRGQLKPETIIVRWIVPWLDQAIADTGCRAQKNSCGNTNPDDSRRIYISDKQHSTIAMLLLVGDMFELAVYCLSPQGSTVDLRPGARSFSVVDPNFQDALLPVIRDLCMGQHSNGCVDDPIIVDKHTVPLCYGIGDALYDVRTRQFCCNFRDAIWEMHNP